MTLKSILEIVLSPKFGFRKIILVLAVFLSVTSYNYVVDFYNPDLNFLSYFRVAPRTFQFFSGLRGGFYTRIGTQLEKNTKNSGQIHLVNQSTNGGAENAMRVLTTRRSFGLLQENTLGKSDMIRQKLKFVTPLYLERMHVLYRRSRIDELAKNNGENWTDPPYVPQLKSNLQALDISFFKNAKVNAGPVGSSTLIIASYILDFIEAEMQSVGSLDVKSMSTTDAIKLLKKKELDVHFVMSAAPVLEILDALKDEDIGLMAIDPSMVSKINKQFGITLRLADFRDIYDQEVTTLGSYSQLVCSKDVSESDAAKVAQLVKQFESEIQYGLPLDGHLPLSEFDFYQTVSDDLFEQTMKFMRSLFVFIVSVFTTTGFVTTAIVWGISNGKFARYFSVYQDIWSGTAKLLPDNVDAPVAHPDLGVDELFDRFVELEGKRSKAVENLITDASTGGITDSHFTRLRDLFNELHFEMRNQLKNEYEYMLFQGKSIQLNSFESCLKAGLVTLSEIQTIKEKSDGGLTRQPEANDLQSAIERIPQLGVLLKKFPVDSLGDFGRYTAEQLSSTKGFGAKSLEKLLQILKQSGVHLLEQ